MSLYRNRTEEPQLALSDKDMLPLQMPNVVLGWPLKMGTRPPALQQTISHAADVTPHQAMLDGKLQTYAIERNDRLGALPLEDVQLKVEHEGRGGEAGVTEHEQALDYILNKPLPRYVL